MNILFTGASGFLGRYIYEKLLADGHNLKILSWRESNILNNLCNDSSLQGIDLVIHAAGKAHSIPYTQEEKELFFRINVHKTKELLTALNRLSIIPKYFIFISSVSVYGITRGTGITEEAPLLANDAYGKSKIEAENTVLEWCKNSNVICTILRLPLLAGSNPPGNLEAMIRSIRKGYYVNVSNGNAKKSIVLAKNVSDILVDAAKIGGIYNLTDGFHPSFKELSLCISKQLNKKEPISIPFLLALILSKLGDILGEKAPINTKKLIKITSDLTFDDTKARRVLNWTPDKVIDNFSII